jgi:molecular chaperone DnaJ
MSTLRDYYEVLSISREADFEEIKRSYRKLAIDYHPDRNPDNEEAEEKFKELSEAYSILSDPEKRQLYDQFGHAGVAGNGNFNSGFDFANSFSDVFGDIFQDFFGIGRQGRRSRGVRGEDLRYRLVIDFEEAAFGVDREISYPRLVECDKCLGDGVEPGHSPTECQVCDGKGEVRYQQAFFTMSRTCPNCGGRGKIVEHPCKGCRGEGRTEQDKTLTVKIPPGVDDGNRLRIRGEGDSGLGGGSDGDLFVQIDVKEHPFFSRDSDHIICEVPIKMETAALGGSVEIPTLDGTMDLKIPAGTQPGQVFHFKGKGIPHLQGSGRGDQYVRVAVEIPSKLTRKQKQLMEEAGSLGKSSSYKSVGDYTRRMEKFSKK